MTTTEAFASTFENNFDADGCAEPDAQLPAIVQETDLLPLALEATVEGASLLSPQDLAFRNNASRNADILGMFVDMGRISAENACSLLTTGSRANKIISSTEDTPPQI